MHPYCGTDLQIGTRITAIVQIVWYSIILLLLLIPAFIYGTVLLISSLSSRGDLSGIGVIIGVVLMSTTGLGCVATIGSIIFSFILFKAAEERSVKKCRIWLFFRVIIWIITIILLLGGIVAILYFTDDNFAILYFIPLIFQLCLDSYFIFAVLSFVSELETTPTESMHSL